MIKDNYYILTGGPGSGKTSVLKQLRKSGFETVDEVARNIIFKQNEIGGNATHNGDRHKFRSLMLEASIRDFKKHQLSRESIFFDRGIADLIGYSQLIDNPPDLLLTDAVKRFRYNKQIFIFPPWFEIYCNDKERQQDFSEALNTYRCIKEGYLKTGYDIVEVPLDSIEARVEFILNYVVS
ncbi:MAG: AAA family ATPase [Francisellaceae bacterium]